MNEFRRLAEKIDRQMQQLADHRINDAPTIIHRMMAYVPDLHKIWVGTSDEQLIALSNEFPRFYRYAVIMEDASEAERRKASRPYDDLPQLSEPYQQQAVQLLSTAATLESGYQAFFGSAHLETFQLQVSKMNLLHRQWLVDLESFKNALQAQGAEPKMMAYMNEAFGHLANRIKMLAG